MMRASNPPNAGSICAQCPHPDIEAKAADHFGQQAWEFHCNQAQEVHVSGEGIQINCAALHGPCCVENGSTIYVNSPQISILKSFLETTLNYFKT
jgi:hypothetical protein